MDSSLLSGKRRRGPAGVAGWSAGGAAPRPRRIRPRPAVRGRASPASPAPRRRGLPASPLPLSEPSRCLPIPHPSRPVAGPLAFPVIVALAAAAARKAARFLRLLPPPGGRAGGATAGPRAGGPRAEPARRRRRPPVDRFVECWRGADTICVVSCQGRMKGRWCMRGAPLKEANPAALIPRSQTPVWERASAKLRSASGSGAGREAELRGRRSQTGVWERGARRGAQPDCLLREAHPAHDGRASQRGESGCVSRIRVDHNPSPNSPGRFRR